MKRNRQASVSNTANIVEESAFRNFQRFPLEIREEIWDLVPGRRVIEVLLNPLTFQFYHYTPPPVTLFVSRESRVVALRCYKLLTIDHNMDMLPSHPMTMGSELVTAQDKLLLGVVTKSRYHPDDMIVSIWRQAQITWNNRDGMNHSIPMVRARGEHPFSTYIDYRRDTIYLEHYRSRHLTTYWASSTIATAQVWRELGHLLMEFMKRLVLNKEVRENLRYIVSVAHVAVLLDIR